MSPPLQTRSVLRNHRRWRSEGRLPDHIAVTPSVKQNPVGAATTPICGLNQITCGAIAATRGCCDAKTQYCINGRCEPRNKLLLSFPDEFCFRQTASGGEVDEFCASGIRTTA